MSAAPRFAVVEDKRPERDFRTFVASVARRVTWRSLAIAIVAFMAIEQVRDVGTRFGGHPDPTNTPPELWISYLVIEACMASCLMLGILSAEEAVQRGAARGRAFLVGIVVAAAIGATLQYTIRLGFGLRTMLSGEEFLVRITQPLLVFLDFVLTGGLAAFVYVNLRTARQANVRQRAAEIARLEAGRRTYESRLQAMQARVEPQFLFNTLAQVRQLYETDPELAGRMLDDLIAYLRAALPHLRETSSTLGKEAALARAYLDIVRIRLGERLSFDIEVPDSLADARLPPMMLLPLIDHVLVYGLEPSQSGGTIRVETGIGQGKLRLAITDSGAGFVPGGQSGDLDSIGERLFALYGEDAALRLERAQGHATQAILEIPYEIADGSDR